MESWLRELTPWMLAAIVVIGAVNLINLKRLSFAAGAAYLLLVARAQLVATDITYFDSDNITMVVDNIYVKSTIYFLVIGVLATDAGLAVFGAYKARKKATTYEYQQQRATK